jgi:hypothetical protein
MKPPCYAFSIIRKTSAKRCAWWSFFMNNAKIIEFNFHHWKLIRIYEIISFNQWMPLHITWRSVFAYSWHENMHLYFHVKNEKMCVETLPNPICCKENNKNLIQHIQVGTPSLHKCNGRNGKHNKLQIVGSYKTLPLIFNY